MTVMIYQYVQGRNDCDGIPICTGIYIYQYVQGKNDCDDIPICTG